MRSVRLQVADVFDPECTRCVLHESTTTVCVPYRGNPRAPIMLIGEAPGRAEAETGKPFMGQSGKLMNQWLERLEMTTSVYITNVCKCRPPDNRTPTDQEMKICTSYFLDREVSLVKPDIFVLLGRTAISWAFGGRKFTRHKIIEMDRQFYIPTWHPAYCLRAGRKPLEEFGNALMLAKEFARERQLQRNLHRS